jgi:hypothetical protein
LRIFVDKKGVLEVCLDKNLGFLLGESMARNWSKHSNFIYIENREALKKTLVVVVRDGKVQLDTWVSIDEVWTELLPLTVEETEYQLLYFGFGDQFLVEFAENGSRAVLSDLMLKRAVSLPQSAVDTLPLYLDLQLLPCEKALQESAFSATSKGVWLALLAIVIAMTVVFLGIKKPQEVDSASVILSPYAGYYQGLSQQPASEVLGSVIRVLSQVFLLPAIQLQRIEYGNDELSLHFVDQQAALSPLLSFARQNQFEFSLHASSVKLTQKKHFKPVNVKNKIYSATELYVYLSDQLRNIHLGSGFRLLSSKQEKNWKVWTCEWRVRDLTAADLDWLRRIVANAPVSCDNISLAYHDGAMQGTIHLKIWGT